MSIFQTTAVVCPQCDTRVFASLVDTINVDRFPELRERVLVRDLHRVHCPRCNTVWTVQKKLLYMHSSRNTFILVATPRSRPDYARGPEVLDKLLAQVPEPSVGAGGRFTRTVFGLEELREKLVAQDAGFDDRIVEVLKAYALGDHPVLMQRSRLRVVLESVDTATVRFTAFYDHDPERYEIRIERTIVDRVIANSDAIQATFAAVHQESSIFAAPPAAWINFGRWSPPIDASALLRSFAERARQGGPVDPASADFRRMLRDLPRGSHLSGVAKRDLRDLRDFFRQLQPPNEALLDRLFEIRFDKGLEDEWAVNLATGDIPRIWDVLEALPPMNVEGNTKLLRINVNQYQGGGLYQWSGEIELGDAYIESAPAMFDSTVRHEIGHAVMAHIDATRNGMATRWVGERFGWRYFDPKDSAQLEQWIQMMVPDWPNVPGETRRQIRDAVRASLGPGRSWGPPPPYQLPPGHLWNSPDFGPRLACERSTSNWFDSNRDWQRSADGSKTFFANYWYAWPMVVDTAALDMVNGFMPSTYAAMSYFEFFAELYALYFSPDDPRRQSIPDDVVAWFNANVGTPVQNGGAPVFAALFNADPAAPRLV